MIVKYLLFLGIGHLLGDFYLQTEEVANYKEKNFKGVLFHTLEYYVAVLMVTLPIFSKDMVFAATYAALIHFVIDAVKYLFLKTGQSSCKIFVIDQCVHIISIFLLVYIMDKWNFTIGHLGGVSYWMNKLNCDAEVVAKWVLSILFIHKPVNIFIQNFLSEYRPKTDDRIIKADRKAGRKIGTIERLIMLIFLSKDQYAALGFVLTAKSIARYDKIAKDETFAEYYLLGTLVSTLCVIICRILIL